MILTHYILALLTPSGRLPRMSYIALTIGLAIAHALAWRLIEVKGEDDVYGIWGGMLLFVMWMQFCIVSRRMHDVGRTNQLAAGLFMLTFFTYLACLDPSLLGKDEEAQEYWGGILAVVVQITRLAWMFIAVELIKQDGEGGSNMYGPEFGAAGVNAAKVEKAQMALADAYASSNGVSTMKRGAQVASIAKAAIEPAATVAAAPRACLKPRTSSAKSMRTPLYSSGGLWSR